ncbi:sperm-associated acrosin inhibitor-like [Manis pentadactyla]|uniref:sperm-associated acrosin inhibitor-like n=1 Tax=Manis pentadactyla TaxID=143292 RepID=UPI00255CCD6E|nr:sperm-associated acrosin inhibitor-like [Manis pentadactyla]
MSREALSWCFSQVSQRPSVHMYVLLICGLRLDKMHFFSSWIKAIFIIALEFPLYSETAFVPAVDIRELPDSSVYADQPHFYTREMDPVCRTNGQTYSNRCVFCSEKL